MEVPTGASQRNTQRTKGGLLQKRPFSYICNHWSQAGSPGRNGCYSFASSNLMNMKTLAITLMGSALIGLMSFVSSPRALQTETHKTVTFEDSFLDLSGIMTINNEKVSDYTVHIFQDGSPSDTFQVHSRLEQHYALPIGHNYAIKFTKPGYKDRILLIDTHIDARKVESMYSFRYSIEFITEGESNTFDDFPVAYITYNEKQKDFDYDRNYHQNVRMDAQPSPNQTASKNWK